MLQVPPALTTTLPSTVVPFGAYKVIVSPAVPVPLIAGLGLLVIESFRLIPVSLAASCVSVALRPIGATVSSTKSPSLTSGVVITRPAGVVVTVVTSTEPLPSVAKSAAVSTTGLLVPSLIIVLVTVPFTPTKVMTEVLPDSLLTVITPVGDVASALVLLASPCGVTNTLNSDTTSGWVGTP